MEKIQEKSKYSTKAEFVQLVYTSWTN